MPVSFFSLFHTVCLIHRKFSQCYQPNTPHHLCSYRPKSRTPLSLTYATAITSWLISLRLSLPPIVNCPPSSGYHFLKIRVITSVLCSNLSSDFLSYSDKRCCRSGPAVSSASSSTLPLLTLFHQLGFLTIHGTLWAYSNLRAFAIAVSLPRMFCSRVAVWLAPFCNVLSAWMSPYGVGCSRSALSLKQHPTPTLSIHLVSLYFSSQYYRHVTHWIFICLLFVVF